MNVGKKITATLSEKAEKYYNEVAYGLDFGNGKTATQSQVINYMLETLSNIEAKFGDPIDYLRRHGWDYNKDIAWEYNVDLQYVTTIKTTGKNRQRVFDTIRIESKNVVKKVVALHNEGADLRRIENYLWRESLCSEMDKKIIINGIKKFLNPKTKKKK